MDSDKTGDVGGGTGHTGCGDCFKAAFIPSIVSEMCNLGDGSTNDPEAVRQILRSIETGLLLLILSRCLDGIMT